MDVPWLLGFVDSTVQTIDLLDQDLISLFPNPTLDRFRIFSDERMMRIELFDMQGQMSTRMITNSREVEIDMSSLASGIYLAHVYLEDGLVVRKVIKQ